MTRGFLYFLLMAAFSQNFVLTTGFGSSLVLRIPNQKKDIWLFNLYLFGFSLVTAIGSYFADRYFSNDFLYVRYFRPFVFVTITVVLYVIVAVVLWKFFLKFYRRCKTYMSVAAFNNILLGVALIANARFSLTLPEIIGLSIGSTIGFVVLLQLMIAALPRLKNRDVPAAFRGLPISLIYLGLLSLALAGFRSAEFI